MGSEEGYAWFHTQVTRVGSVYEEFAEINRHEMMKNANTQLIWINRILHLGILIKSRQYFVLLCGRGPAWQDTSPPSW